MRRARSIPVLTLVLGLSLGFPGASGAQNAGAAWRSTPASLLKSALRTLVAAQDKYRSTHAGYASSIESLSVPAGPEVKLQILGATPQG